MDRSGLAYPPQQSDASKSWKIGFGPGATSDGWTIPRVILDGEVNVQPPAEIAEMILPADKMEAWRKDFANGGPADCRTQSYGSDEFESKIREDERALQLKLAHEQYLEARKKK